MKVKFLRSIIAGGEHRELGSVATLDKDEAIQLITAGDCSPVKEIETAQLKPSGKEKAAR